MLNDPTPSHQPDDASPDTTRHPAFGKLCRRCGTASGAADHWDLCRRMGERPGLWADGWVDLAAFGLDERAVVGWPEVCTGPVAKVMYGGLGPESMFARNGPWVRHPDPSVPTWRRVAAAQVLVAAGHDPVDAVDKVVAAGPVRIDTWCRPRVVVMHTLGCGDDHYVRIERGLPPERDRCRPSARDRGEVVFRVTSSATCEEAVARWRTASVGWVQLDISKDPDHRYKRIGHDPGVLDAQRIFVAATLAKVRGAFLEAGEPDRWLVFEGLPSRIGAPALLRESTRPIAMALVTAPPTWLWSTEPLT